MSTKFLEQQDGNIAFDDAGSGPLVVCVPSMGDVRLEYRFLAPRLLSAGYRVVTLDVRGHGETSPSWPDYSVAAIGSDLVALIRSLDAGPAIIIGDSMAAGAAVWAAVEAPQKVASLVLMDPFVSGETSWPMRLLFAVLFARPWGPAMWRKYYATLYPTRKPDDFEAYCDALRSNLGEPGRMEALQKMLVAPKTASGQRLSRVTAPALVIMGSKDRDFKEPEAEAQKLAESLRATYKMVPEAGHYPHAELPEVTGPLILSFLQTLKQPVEGVYAEA
jgi:pimeloyl-ACP methyl ester carboxylesterase